MTNAERPWWVAILESYPCPTCGALAGHRCRTGSGQVAPTPHADRAREADRCTKCGRRLEPGHGDTLCDYCAAIRRLELERFHHHRRLDDR